MAHKTTSIWSQIMNQSTVRWEMDMWLETDPSVSSIHRRSAAFEKPTRLWTQMLFPITVHIRQINMMVHVLANPTSISNYDGTAGCWSADLLIPSKQEFAWFTQLKAHPIQQVGGKWVSEQLPSTRSVPKLLSFEWSLNDAITWGGEKS